jgi:beta-galactosidase/beta-glucuronidase
MTGQKSENSIAKSKWLNAIRTSHNPPSPALLDACDRLGMLVIDEALDTWKEKKNREDYNVYFNEWWQRDLEAWYLEIVIIPLLLCGVRAMKYQIGVKMK